MYFDATNRPWTAYTDVQKQVTMDIALTLAQHYGVKAIVGKCHWYITSVRACARPACVCACL